MPEAAIADFTGRCIELSLKWWRRRFPTRGSTLICAPGESVEYCGHFFSSKDGGQSCWQAGAFHVVDSVELQLQDVAVEE